MAEADYIVVGSGINGLVCAAMLGLKGRKVLLLERNDRIGGCIRTEAITEPGFIHDVMATTFVLFVTSPAYAALGPELEKRGLSFAQSDVPTGVLRPDGSHLVLTRSRDANRSAFEAAAAGDGAAFDREMALFGTNAGLVFSVLGSSCGRAPCCASCWGSFGNAGRAAWRVFSAKRSSRRGRTSKAATRRASCRICSHLGCSIRALGRKAPIRERCSR